MAALVIWLPFHQARGVATVPNGPRHPAGAAEAQSATRHTSSSRTYGAASARQTTQLVFGSRWRVAWCVSFYESRHYLGARNGANLGPWQINVVAHPWVNPWKLTHSWIYSAKVAYRISSGGTDWTAWTTHGLCGV